MAKFNPDIPEATSLDYYGRLSRPITAIPGQKYTADTSTGVALSGIGDVVESAAKVSDMLIKDSAAQAVESKLDPLTKQHTQEVAQVRDSMYGSKLAQNQPSLVGNQQPSTAGADIDPSKVPPGITRGLGRIDSLSSIRQSGKMSETQYKGEVDKIASDIRSQYPSIYRRFIDRHIAEVTGIPHTANAYVQSMIGDINDAVAHRDAEHNKIDSKILSNLELGPDMAHLREQWKNGKISDEGILSTIAQRSSYKYGLEVQKLALSADKETQEANTRAAGRVMNQEANVEVNNQMVRVLDEMGFKDVAKDPAKMTEALASLKSDQAEQLRTMLQAQQVATSDRLMKSWSMPQRATKANPDGKSIMEISGWSTETANKAIADAHNFHAVADKYLGGEASPITATARWIKQRQDANTRELLEDPKLGPTLADIKSLEQTAGSAALPTFMHGEAFLKLPDALQAHREEKEIKSLTRPGRSVYNDLQDGSTKGRAAGYSEGELGKLTDTYPDRLKEILPDPKVKAPAKEAMVEYAYGAKNAGMFAAFADRNVDYYSKFFDPLITKSIKQNLSAKAWDTYKDRAQSAFASEIATPLVKKLNTMASEPSVGVTFDDADSANPFNYDMGNIKNVVGNTTRGIAHPYDQQMADLNKAYRSMADIARADGQDVNKYVFGVFKAIGANDKVSEMFAKAMQSTKPPKVQNPTP